MIARRTLLQNLAALTAIGAVQMGGTVPAMAQEREEILLWPGNPPGGGGVTGPEKLGDTGAGFGALSNISTPRMRVYRPAKANGAAVVVCGGGGYFRIQLWKESTPIARWLQEKGFTVFELIYRLPNDGWDASVPFMDAQRAMKIARTRAAEFGVDPQQIGIMGFSAGGHLAGFTALQPQRALYAGADKYEKVSARPDFSVLLFPVVSLRKPYDTTRTRRELIGETPSAEAENAWSLDTYASADAPPTIIFASSDDKTAPPGHGIMLYEKLNGAGASAELHLFRDGGHGWGLGRPEQVLSQWPDMFVKWFNSGKIVQNKQGE
ncbi:alpha/beta hydrolase [Sphingorhabdus lacus]|jgi:acetyl esterase/lipase|uniref:Alpha/beta hydrolase n=1 Tax=Sphingorhabdus lacus TaxID=392610 RepID=A0A6I6LI04_9SPHN|nr:alpha/beta hydrolase [Sphingorhabdus lacus]QGY81993.1 alpha/beta hydrolase [Sphingorhabdus lacus]